MRTTIGLVPTLLLGMLATPILGFAASRCDLDGSWYGAISSGQEILVTHHKGDELKGTSVLEVPGFDPTLGGSFPAAVKTSTFRGVWERIDNRNFTV